MGVIIGGNKKHSPHLRMLKVHLLLVHVHFCHRHRCMPFGRSPKISRVLCYEVPTTHLFFGPICSDSFLGISLNGKVIPMW